LQATAAFAHKTRLMQSCAHVQATLQGLQQHDDILISSWHAAAVDIH